MKNRVNPSRLALAALLLGMAACAETSAPPETLADIQLWIHAGDHQVGDAGKPLPLPLAVRITSRSGAPLSGVTVRWLAKDPTDKDEGGEVASTTTNEDGIASVAITLSGQVGVHVTTAVVGPKKIKFTSVALIQRASQMKMNPTNHGNNQVDTVLATLAPFKVLVLDHLNRPVAGVQVEWSVLDGRGFPHHARFTTSNADGVAEMAYTPPSGSGYARVQAAVPGLAGSPVRFDAQIKPGNPVTFSILRGHDQWGKLGTTILPYEVDMRDKYGNGVGGVQVDWAVVSGGGSLQVPQSTTAGWGGAYAIHRLGPAEGEQTVSATAVGMAGAPTVIFTAVGVPELVFVSNFRTDEWYDYFDKYEFRPASITASAGAEVVWRWECRYCMARALHNVTFEDDPTQPVSSPDQVAGTHRRTFNNPGTYRYRCTFHSTSFTEGRMIGTVVVQ